MEELHIQKATLDHAVVGYRYESESHHFDFDIFKLRLPRPVGVEYKGCASLFLE